MLGFDVSGGRDAEGRCCGRFERCRKLLKLQNVRKLRASRPMRPKRSMSPMCLKCPKHRKRGFPVDRRCGHCTSEALKFRGLRGLGALRRMRQGRAKAAATGSTGKRREALENATENAGKRRREVGEREGKGRSRPSPGPDLRPPIPLRVRP